MKKDSEGVRRVLKIISILLVIPCIIFGITGVGVAIYDRQYKLILAYMLFAIAAYIAWYLPRIIWFSSYTLIDWILEGFRKDKRK